MNTDILISGYLSFGKGLVIHSKARCLLAFLKMHPHSSSLFLNTNHKLMHQSLAPTTTMAFHI